MTETLHTPDPAICRHGIPYSRQCSECDLASAREIVAHWGEKVDEARRVIAQTNNPLIAKLYEGLDRLEELNRRKR